MLRVKWLTLTALGSIVITTLGGKLGVGLWILIIVAGLWGLFCSAQYLLKEEKMKGAK